MFGVPGVQFLIVRIVSQLSILLVGLYELDRLQVGEFILDIVQVEHEPYYGVLRAVILQKVDFTAYDETVENLVEAAIKRERLVSVAIGQCAGDVVRSFDLLLLLVTFFGVFNGRRHELDHDGFLYAQIVHIQLGHEYAFARAVTVNHPQAILVNAKVNATDMLAVIAVHTAILFDRVVFGQIERYFAHDSLQM